MPMLVILYFVAFLDRTNVGFAEAALGVDRGITAGAYALGAGIFFIGYALFEIPSNLLLTKFGARLWLARIAITWGIVSAASPSPGRDHVHHPALPARRDRGGSVPGRHHVPGGLVPEQGAREDVRDLLPGTAVLPDDGRPAHRWLISIGDQVPRVAGWQVMFFVEGMLAVIAGIAALLPDEQSAAGEVPQPGRKEGAPGRDGQGGRRSHGRPALRRLAAMASWKVWYFTIIYFCLQIAVYGMTFYLPQQVAGLIGQDVGSWSASSRPSRGSSASSPATSSEGGQHHNPTPQLGHRPLHFHRPVIFGSAWAGANNMPGSASCSSPSPSPASSRSDRSPGPTRRRSSPEQLPQPASA